MSMRKVELARQLDSPMSNWEEIDGKKIEVKKPQLLNRSPKISDRCHDLYRMGLSELEGNSGEEESVIVGVSGSMTSESSESVEGNANVQVVKKKYQHAGE